MTNDGNLFVDKITNWIIYEAGFKHSKCQIYTYYKYTKYRSRLVVLSYFNDFIYWYKSEELGQLFVDTLGKRFHVNFLGYAHCFISVSISQFKEYCISADQDSYDTSVVAKYLDTVTIKQIQSFIILPYLVI